VLLPAPEGPTSAVTWPAGATKAAVARTAPTVATLRDFGNCEIDRRLITLVRLSAAVGGSAGLSSSDAAALSADIAAARSGLRSLKATIDTQTRIPALKVEIVQIVTRYRVYVLLGPQVRLSIAADDVIAIKPHFDGISTTLAARIAAAQAGGKDEAAAQTALNAMNAAVENRDLNTRAYENELVETEKVIRAQLMEALMQAQHYKAVYDHLALQSQLNLLVGTEVLKQIQGVK